MGQPERWRGRIDKVRQRVGKTPDAGDGLVSELLLDDADELVALVSDIDEAASALPEAERRAYEDAQESIVEARRSAEVHEGTLQLN